MNHIEWWLQEQNIDLYLRQDNADLRLTEKGYEIGLVTEERYNKILNEKRRLKKKLERLKNFKVTTKEKYNDILDKIRFCN